MEYKRMPPMLLDEMGGYYCKHVTAMTRENLHSKSDIAAELGHRDVQIDSLKSLVNKLYNLNKNLCKAVDSGDKERIELAMRDSFANLADINMPKELEK